MCCGRAATHITRRLQGDECPWQRELPPHEQGSRCRPSEFRGTAGAAPHEITPGGARCRPAGSKPVMADGTDADFNPQTESDAPLAPDAAASADTGAEAIAEAEVDAVRESVEVTEEGADAPATDD